MAKSPNQKLKLLYLVDILERKTDENHPMTAAALIEELDKVGVSAERRDHISKNDGNNRRAACP